jgi:hypothetical protein
MSGISHKIEIEITFTETGDIKKIRDLRISAQIQEGANVNNGLAMIKIWGLTEHDMAQLTVIGNVGQNVQRNSVKVFADDDLVYYGAVQRAWADFDAMPEVFFTLDCSTNINLQTDTPQPTSLKGDVKVADLFKLWATESGMLLENIDVDYVESNPNYEGSTQDKINRCGKSFNVFHFVNRGVLYISKNALNSQKPIIQLNADTGLIKSPKLTNDGLIGQMLFNPRITSWDRINITSQQTRACGLWNAFRVSHDISVLMPDSNQWFTNLLLVKS